MFSSMENNELDLIFQCVPVITNQPHEKQCHLISKKNHRVSELEAYFKFLHKWAAQHIDLLHCKYASPQSPYQV